MLRLRRKILGFDSVKPCQLHWVTSFSYSYSDIPSKKPKVAPLQERKMIDRFKLWAKGGDGGNGCSSFRRSRHDRHWKPDGGNGGRGGDVILECSAAVWDFSNLQHHLNAKRGGNGASKNKVGSRGADKVGYVPVGTVIHLVTGEVPVADERSSRVLDPWESQDEVGTDASASPHSNCKKTQNKRTQELKYSRKFSSYVCKNTTRSSSSQASDSEMDNSSIEDSLSNFDGTENESNFEETENEYEDVNFDDLTEDFDGEEEVSYDVAEVTKPGQRLIVAHGGEGGLGNVSSAKLPLPKFHKNYSDRDNEFLKGSDTHTFEGEENSPSQGLPGSEAVLILELKSIADVGLVGMPNTGKSTLLGAISRAKPVVGDYAFTTLRPNIGNLNYEDFFSVTVADIPGIIKGAHENRGLGHAFLRHIERTKVLAYVVDLAAALDGRKGVSPWEQLKDLVLELEYHQEGLSNRPSIIVANKIDEDGAESVLEELKRRVTGVPIFPVCAVLGEGVPELKDGLRELVDGRPFGRLKLDNIEVD